MAGKRVAGKQLHKHSMDRSDSESDCDDASFNQDRADVNRRVISKPKRRLGGQDKPSFSFKGLMQKQEAVQTPPAEAPKSGENHWLKIRGLNVSFSKSVQSDLEKDPMTDLSKLFEKYVRYRNDIAATSAGEVKEAAVQVSPTAAQTKENFTLDIAPTPMAALKASQEEFKNVFNFAPVQPVDTFPKANPATALPSEPLKPINEQKPKFEFSFPKAEITTKSDAPLPFSFGAKTEEAAKPAPPIAFNPEETSKPTGAFSFGAKFEDAKSSAPQSFTFGTKPEAENTAVPQSSETISSAAPFSFGAKAESSAKPAVPFSFGAKLQESSAAEKPFSFSFGAKPLETDLPVTPSEKPANPFSFGKASGDTSSTTPSTSFFSFGTQSTTSETKTETPFKFSFPQPTNTNTGLLSPSATQSQSQQKEGDAAAAEDDAPLQPAQISLIRTGAGEEDEECMAESRVKLFSFEKEGGWIDLGVGIFKVNRRKEDAKTEIPNRILCRSEVSGIVLLNSAIQKDATKTEWTDGKKDMKVTCINQEGKIASYLVRCKEASDTQKLNDAIVSLTA